MKQIILLVKDLLNKVFCILNNRQRYLTVVVFFLTLVGALLEVIGVSAVLPLIQAMLYPDQLKENEIVMMAVNILHIGDDVQLLLLIAVGVVLVYLIKNGYLVFLSYVRVKYASLIKKELGIRVMKIYMKQGYPFFIKHNTNDLYRGINGDASGIYNILNFMFRLISEGITVSCICIYMFMTDYLMALFVAVMAIISVLVIVLWGKNRIRTLGEEYRKYDMITKRWSAQAFQGIKEVLVLKKQDFFVKKYSESTDRQQAAMIKQTIAAESPTYILEFTCVTGLILAVVARVLMGVDNSSFILDIAAFAVSAFRIMPSLGRITNSVNNILFSIPALNKTYETIIGQKNNGGKEKDEEEQNSRYSQIEFRREIELRNICWRYDGGKEDTIHHLNLTIKKGESVALIGESGTGKSTTADIILGLFRPQQGVVRMDGIDIREMPERWNQLIGYVPQSVYLLDDTIRNNIAFGVEPEEIDDNKIWKVLEQAQLKSYVEKLPEGLETVLGEQGVRFSGGQRQRIAIARALYFEPDILVLDEATSALDNKTEEAVMEAVDMLQGWKTLIIIAHRLSTIQKCDHVYEIVDGRAVERRIENADKGKISVENKKV